MNNHEYEKYIQQLIPTIFTNIYIIDIMSDLVTEYLYENNIFNTKQVLPFTSFYEQLEKIIHPEDIKGYIDNISSKNLQENLNNGIKHIFYEYRIKLDSGEYDWHTNIIKLIEDGQKKLALVLVQNTNEKNDLININNNGIEKYENQKTIIINAVSNFIIKLNTMMNINNGNNNPEIKSIMDYVKNTIFELTSSTPELDKALANNIIVSTNQGTDKTLLVVDDDIMTCKLLTKTFEQDYKIVVANNGQEAISILEKNNDITSLDEKDKIVGMFLDLNMPVVDGFGVLDYMSSKNLLLKMPVIIISGDYDQDTKDKAYLYPIADVLEKPFNVQVVRHRIKTLVKLYKTNNSLNEMVLTQHQDIKNVLKTVVRSYLYDNSNDIKRITNYVNVIARQMSIDYTNYNFDENRLIKLTEASRYYNIGLYTLPHKLFKKQDFNSDEIKIIKSHPFIGLSLFDSVLYKNTDSIFNNYAKNIIKYHEEKYDGTGYPNSIKGNQIPIEAQIISVAIEYNELLKVMNESSVLEEIIKGSGTKFNPQVVESLKKCVDKIKLVNEKIGI